MSLLSPELSPLLRFLPVEHVGTTERIEPIRAGLSGAGVYAVTTSQGSFVLRVQDRNLDENYFAQQLRVLRRAEQAGVAPRIAHVDEAARAIVSARISGKPLGAALADPAQRNSVLASAVEHLRALHSLDSSGVADRDPMRYADETYRAVRERSGFPVWASDLETEFGHIRRLLARDPRKVVNHNDVNPGNLLWDGERVWLVDWEVTGLDHPHYDLATLALFLRLDDDAALGLAAMHDGAPLSPDARVNFRALRKLSGLLCGLTFLSLVQDLSIRPAPGIEHAPTLSEVYQGMQRGEHSLQSPLGQTMMGLALLAMSINLKLE
ncbi:MAG TPA: phosphotransferase [Polyangiaceae bacterium]|nr:phosphotransferase [Polyangiaceae bacterium]